LSPTRSHPDGTNIARNEHKKFEPKQLNTAAGVQEGAALAPAEGQLQDTNDRWAKGEMDEVEVSSMKNRL
jgi:hypothetical protein